MKIIFNESMPKFQIIICYFMGKEFFKIKINKIMNKDKLTNMAILFIKHEYANISFETVIGKLAQVKFRKLVSLFITVIGQ